MVTLFRDFMGSFSDFFRLIEPSVRLLPLWFPAMPARGNGKHRSTRNSQRIKNLEEQDILYQRILAKSLSENMTSNSSGSNSLPSNENGGNPTDGSGKPAPPGSSVPGETGEEASGSKGDNTEKSPKHKRTHEVSDSEKDLSDHSPSKKAKNASPDERVILKPKKGGKGKQKSSASGSVNTDNTSSATDSSQNQFSFPQQGMFGYQNQFPLPSGFSDPRNNWWWQSQMAMNPMNFNSMNPQFMGSLNANQQQNQNAGFEEDSEEDSEDGDSDTPTAKSQAISIGKSPVGEKGEDKSPDEKKSGRLGESCSQESKVKTDEKEKDLGPPADETLVDMLKNFLERSRKQANVDELLGLFPRPENMPFLKAPKIEEDLFPRLAQHIKNYDKACRWLQKYISGAITALVRAITTLIEKEKQSPDEDLYQAGIKIQSALKLLAYTHTEINHRRKDALRNTVNADCLPLLKHNRPSSNDWLLGQNLSDSIKEMEDSKKISERILKSSKTSSTFQPQTNKQVQGKNKRFRYKKGNKGGHQTTGYRHNNQNQGFYQAQPAPFPGMVAPMQLQGPRFPNPTYQAVPFQHQNMGGNSGWRLKGPETRFQNQKRKH